MNRTPAARAVVVGGGFAGAYATRQLAHHGIATTVVDTSGFQVFQPMLYQAATGLVDLEDVRYDLHQIEHAQIVAASAAAIDGEQGQVRLGDGTRIDADYIIVATGAGVNFFGVPGGAEYAFPLYTSQDADAIHTRLKQLLSAGEGARIVVVGGGATGVEITGALSDIFTGVVPQRLPGFPCDRVRITLVDGADRLLTSMSADSGAYARKVLEGNGVDFRLGRRVTSISATSVTLDDDSEIVSDMTIWAGGLSPRIPQITPEPALGKGGRAIIDPDLRLPGQERVYCIGDASIDPDQPLPQLGSVAKQQGLAAAHNIRRQVAGQPTKPFRYQDLGDMAMVARNAAVVEMGSEHRQVEGRLAFLMWLGLHAYLLPGHDHRVDALRTWMADHDTGTPTRMWP